MNVYSLFPFYELTSIRTSLSSEPIEIEAASIPITLFFSNKWTWKSTLLSLFVDITFVRRYAADNPASPDPITATLTVLLSFVDNGDGVAISSIMFCL